MASWADVQTAGRGRLNHKWVSAEGRNLTFSAVFDVSGLEPGEIATFPLVAGLAVAKALERFGVKPRIKWPNDILADGKKLCGILCELYGTCIVCGIGLNVLQTRFPKTLNATSLALLGLKCGIDAVFDALLEVLGGYYELWRKNGFASLLPEFARYDILRGRIVRILAKDDDSAPVEGFCEGIAADGTLVVAGRSIPAGEAHIASSASIA